MTDRPIEPSFQVPAGDPGAVKWQAERYLLRHLLDALDALDEPEDLRAFFERLESDGFLARQAELPGGFETGGRQIERHILPATVRAGDWERFFRYLLTACSLRSLGRTLDDPTILQALARSGRRPLAEALVGRLPEPAARARGWAVLAAASSPVDPAFERLAEAFRAELDRMPEGTDPESPGVTEGWVDALETAGRALAPLLRARWSGWIERLAVETARADRVRLAVAEGFFDAGEPDAPELWEVLATVEDLEELARFLPERLARAEKSDPLRWLDTVRERLPRVEDDPRSLWSIGLALVSRRDGDVGEGWHHLRTVLPPAPWSAELLERGAAVWPRLAEEDLDALASGLERPDQAARLKLLVLEGRAGLDEYRATLSLLVDLDAGDEILSLYLRALRAAPPEVEREARSRVKGVLAHLSDLQYAVSPEDLGRALDLAAAHLPLRRLRRTLDAAFGAPGSNSRTLRLVAEAAEEDGLLEELLKRAETYAAMVAADAAEGFELRGDLLILLGCRMVERGAETAILEEVAGRLLPEEEDRLRATAARVVARNVSGSGFGDAKRLCEGIRNPGLRLRVHLEILPAEADPGELVAPGRLYEVAARWSGVEDTLRTLSGLLDEPRQPARLAAERFDGIEGPGRRVEALADLARHALAYQTRRYRSGRQDRLAAILPLKEGLGVVESDDWLVSLTPELVSIGAHLGARQAVAEVQEAFERVSGLEAVSWEGREAVLIEILGRIEVLFLGKGAPVPLGRTAQRARQERLRQLLVWLVRLPERAGETSAGELLRGRWHRLLPVLTAVSERIDTRTGPGKTWLSSVLPSSWLDRFRPALRTVLEASVRLARGWTSEHQDVIDLCMASTKERQNVADRLLGTGSDRGEPGTVRGLAWLLADEDPDRASALLGRLEPGPERDRVVLEFLRSASVSGEHVGALLGLLSAGDGPGRSWGRVWLGLRDRDAVDDEAWSAAVAELVAHDRLDPAEPETIPVRRRLWTVRPEAGQGLPAWVGLAEAARGALAVGGAAGGERAARLFLNAYVRPRPGQVASSDAFERRQQMEGAVDRARRLESRPGTVSGSPDGSGNEDGPGASRVTPEGLLQRFRRWSRTWSRRPLRSHEHPLQRVPAVALLTGLAGLAVLPPFQTALFGWEGSSMAGAHRFAWALVVLVLLVFANGLLVGSYLVCSTSEDRTVRWPVRWLRTVCTCVPVFGLWTIPVWTWLVTSNKRWVRRPGGQSVAGRSPLLGGRLRPWIRPQALTERLGQWGGRLVVLVALFLANLVAVAEVARLVGSIEARRGVMVFGLFLLHGLLFVAMLAGLVFWVWERRLMGWRRVALPALSLCWLLPVPALPLAGIFGLIVLDSEVSQETLGRHAYEASREVRRFGGWLRLEDRLRRSWGRLGWLHQVRGAPESVRLKTEPSRREQKLLWLFQGKGVALFFEAAWVGSGLWALVGAQRSGFAVVLASVTSVLEVLLLVGGAGALVGLAVAFSREVLRSVTEPRVFGPRLFWGHLLGIQMALLCGLELGTGLACSDFDQAGGALVLIGLGGAVLQAGGALVGLLLRSVPERSWETVPENVVKTLVYVGAGLLGGDLAGEEPGALGLVPLLEAYQRIAPIFGAALGFGALRWLRHAEGSGELERGGPPRRRRLEDFLLKATAIAPFGGLAILWWIRREQRCGSSVRRPSPPPVSRLAGSPPPLRSP